MFVLTLLWAVALQIPVELPTVKDERITISLFAREPDIVTPTGIAIDARGRLFVIENHTHFPPKDYAGPKHDRIKVLVDTNGDNVADKISTFFEGTSSTMNMGLGPDGSLYIATRGEIFALDDIAGKDTAGKPRAVVKLETKGNYPHNGLSGFAFDGKNLWFGLGENLGAAYKLIGTDGVTLEGGGEGGSVYTCRLDGSKLRRVATGFWNPFHLYREPNGQLFAVDNDPDARPPCRLLHVVEGGDYGFKFRYGRNGLHPFHAWNGELPGTLPMVAGTGEAPSGILGGLVGKGWPIEYAESLFVTSWGDHRLERFPLEINGASFRSTMKPVIVGGENFRPVGIAAGKPGDIYLTDWVDKAYEVHGKGRIWKLTINPEPREQSTARLNLAEPSVTEVLATAAKVRQGSSDRLQEHFFDLPPLAQAELVRLAEDENDWGPVLGRMGDLDPFIRTAARDAARKILSAEALAEIYGGASGQVRVELLLTLRDVGFTPDVRFFRSALADPNPDIRLIAVQWIGEAKRKDCREEVEKLFASSGPWTRELFSSALATLELLDRGWAAADAPAQFATRFLDRSDVDPLLHRYAFRLLPPDHSWLTPERWMKLLRGTDPKMRVEVIRTLREKPGEESMKLLRGLLEHDQDPAVRAEALLGYMARFPLEKRASVSAELPGDADPMNQRIMSRYQMKTTQTPHGEEYLKESAARPLADHDGAAGERIFFDPAGPGCYRCHQYDGRGGTAGPDLTRIAQTSDRRRLITSLVDPSREIAPMYQPWLILTTDGQRRVGLLAREGLMGEQFYIGVDGKEFMLQPTEIDERSPSRESLMPKGLLDQLTEDEVGDLVWFLEFGP